MFDISIFGNDTTINSLEINVVSASIGDNLEIYSKNGTRVCFKTTYNELYIISPFKGTWKYSPRN